MTNLPQEGISPEGIFGEPISVYTDAQAVEDGILADMTFAQASFRGLPINRMTGHLHDDLVPLAESQADKRYDGSFGRAFAEILQTKCADAQSVRNTDEVGDIFTIPPNLWLVRNEVGGWTAMYPEDY